MELSKASQLVHNKLVEHELYLWRFEFDNAKRRFGRCNCTKKLITLSRHLVQLNDEATVLETILHEIAHALVGPGHGHDHVWRRKAIEIGSNGQRCYSKNEVNIVKGKYEGTCINCGDKYYRHRRPRRRSSCTSCQTYARGFDETRLIEWEERY